MWKGFYGINAGDVLNPYRQQNDENRYFPVPKCSHGEEVERWANTFKWYIRLELEKDDRFRHCPKSRNAAYKYHCC